MKYVKYFAKQTIIPLVYLVLMALTSMSIGAIEGDNLAWLRLVLSILAFGLYGLVIGAISYKEGEEAMKIRNANDLEREIIIRTGENRRLETVKEFQTWKGFMTGISTCIPLIVLMLIHTVLILINPANNSCGAVAGFLYMVFFMIFRSNATVSPAPEFYYILLIAIPVFALITGLPYMFGGRKIERQQERIREKQRQIYGD